MAETPGEELESIWSMPGVLLTEVSIRLVILESMISGVAPGNIVVTEIIGSSTVG